MIGIVVSTEDEASAHIGEHLLELADWTEFEPDAYRTEGFELRIFDEWHLELDGVADAFDDPDCVVFASRHSGDSGQLLSAHFTGNFGEAEFGGQSRSLSTPCPGGLKEVLAALEANAPEGWDVTMECTHHGPTEVGGPSMFVELGSDEEQWQDPDGARAVAKSILALEGEIPAPSRTVVGFGGNHYAPRPTRLVLETDVAVGHVAADWSLAEFDPAASHSDLLEEMFATSGSTMAVIDGDKSDLVELLESLGYRVVSEHWLRETTGVPPGLVEAVESELAPIDSGVRFGKRTTSETGFVVRDLPDGLLAECQTIDDDRTREVIEEHAIAYETMENGNLLRGGAAFPSENDRTALLEDLVDVLAAEYETAKLTEDAVIAERFAFDPAAARDAGVPEGPKFGRLASGHAVEVDGVTVEPESVRKREKRRFAV